MSNHYFKNANHKVHPHTARFMSYCSDQIDKLIIIVIITTKQKILRKLNVARFGDQGRKDEEVRGDEPQKRCLITQNKTFNTT